MRVLKKSLEYAQQFDIELSIVGFNISGYGKNKMIYLCMKWDRDSQQVEWVNVNKIYVIYMYVYLVQQCIFCAMIRGLYFDMGNLFVQKSIVKLFFFFSN